MKFEQLLRIYWSRKFLYGGNTFNFNVTWEDFWWNLPGLGNYSRLRFIKRFELLFFQKHILNFLYTPSLLSNELPTKHSFVNLVLQYQYPVLFSDLSLDFRKNINMYLGKLISVHNNIFELLRLNLIKLYLIRTYRGRAQALGKPSRGQRTWSNAWTSFNTNHILRNFLKYVQKLKQDKERPEKINYKIVKIKTRVSKKPNKKQPLQKKTPNLWF